LDSQLTVFQQITTRPPIPAHRFGLSRHPHPLSRYLENTLPSRRVQGVYKGCPPGVHGILAGTPDGHPLYTPCTRPEGRVRSGLVYGAPKASGFRFCLPFTQLRVRKLLILQAKVVWGSVAMPLISLNKGFAGAMAWAGRVAWAPRERGWMIGFSN
ncbi:MAG: hypothetical protein KA122_12530, partial [Verrucomicrobia bacterium]|nr:hypothetical protein [Verrucomicrobiota bacterium]